jgi:putative transposase
VHRAQALSERVPRRLDRRRWGTRHELRLAIITWIERTDHRRRRQTSLGRLTPIEYETIITTQVALAA